MELKESEDARKGIVFDLNGISEVKCVENFRIAKADMPLWPGNFCSLPKWSLIVFLEVE